MYVTLARPHIEKLWNYEIKAHFYELKPEANIDILYDFVNIKAKR